MIMREARHLRKITRLSSSERLQRMRRLGLTKSSRLAAAVD